MTRYLATLALLAAVSGMASADEIPLRNWTAPSTRNGSGGLAPLADIGSPGVFVAVNPCRVADTRGLGFTGAYGPPMLSAGTPRTFNVASSGCAGIPSGASAFSLNFTAVQATGAGMILAWPAGGTVPSVSTLNYLAGQTVANAAIVPSGTGGNAGSITVVAGSHGTNLIIDINGYFMNGTGLLNPGESLSVLGTNDGAYVLFVRNYAIGANSVSIAAYSTATSTGAAAINAGQTGVSGRNYAIKTANASTGVDAAAVLGVSPAAVANPGASWSPSGVRGEGADANGVLGIASYSGEGVGGYYVSGGAVTKFGSLGRSYQGVLYGGGLGGSGTKSFLEPHPTDPTKAIKYICLEGGEAGTYFRGRGRIVGGTARIDVPEDFRMVTDPEGLTVQITPMGRAAAVGVVTAGLDGIEVEATRDVEFSYLVQGVRKAYKAERPVVDNVYFRPESPNDRLPAYLSADERQRMVDNGTYNGDGTVNLATAERVGWVREWREEEERRRLASEKAAREVALDPQVNGLGAVPLRR